MNASAAGQAAATFVLHNAALSNTFLLKDVHEFINNHILHDVRPPRVPSPAFDRDWDALKDIGRIDWSGRTLETNLTADYYGCQRVNSSTCSLDGKMHSVLKEILPRDATLAATVTLLAKLSVAIFDAGIVLDNLHYGFWRSGRGTGSMRRCRRGPLMHSLRRIQSSRSEPSMGLPLQ